MPGRFAAEIVHDLVLDSEIIRLEHESPENGGMAVEVAPEFGSNMIRFAYGGHELLEGDKHLLRAGYWTGNFVLWPIPNRVRGKAYEFEGQKVSLEDVRRKEGNDVLIHGLVDELAWRYGSLKSDDNSASATTGIRVTPESPVYRHYPFPSELALTYRLLEKSVRIEYEVENQGASDMPFGFALHPYFATLSGPENTMVTVPADYIMEADEELLPTGKLIPMGRQGYDLRTPTPAGSVLLDHVFINYDV